MSPPTDITGILVAARGGDQAAINRLFPLVHHELEKLARAKLAGWRRSQTLDTAGLIGDLYLRLIDQSRVELRDRHHFFAYAAKAMRRIVIDRVRRRQAEKRGAAVVHVPLDGLEVGRWSRLEEILAVDQALTALAEVSPRQAQVVELRFFAGMQIEEIGDALGVAEKTVRRDWTYGRAFLHRLLAGPGESAAGPGAGSTD